MEMPDGTTLMHGPAPYDPVKAREYYLRTRKLKGRQKAAAVASPKLVKYRAALDTFLKKLPMAIEGADLKTTEAFVDSFRGKSDDELRKAAKNMQNTPGTRDADIKSKTVLALLENRNRIRKQKAKKNTAVKAAGVSVVARKVLAKPARSSLPTLARPANTTKN